MTLPTTQLLLPTHFAKRVPLSRRPTHSKGTNRCSTISIEKVGGLSTQNVVCCSPVFFWPSIYPVCITISKHSFFLMCSKNLNSPFLIVIKNVFVSIISQTLSLLSLCYSQHLAFIYKEMIHV